MRQQKSAPLYRDSQMPPHPPAEEVRVSWRQVPVARSQEPPWGGMDWGRSNTVGGTVLSQQLRGPSKCLPFAEYQMLC